MNIKVLDSGTINQIAAGEVIERPASIVKELMENAIDAKASSLTVEIKDGGTTFIRVTDNGCGIEEDDLRVAFLRHSTSKIHSVEDLLCVSSLGFRGEALSSIAAVCQVELITKTPDALIGNRYCIEGGKETAMESIGAPCGTTFLVRNIFYNTPARRKFLKSNMTEAGYISDVVERIALSNPGVSIRFIQNGQNKLYTSGNHKLKDLIYTIYGRDITANLLELHASQGEMSVSGYVGKPLISRGNRNFENYYINGRYVKSKIITRAIEDAYQPYLMQHKYPFTVFHFSIPQKYLDVNVHPTKMELRFQNSEDIYPFIFDAVSKALEHKEMIPDMEPKKEPAPKMMPEAPKKERLPEPFEVIREQKQETLDYYIKENSPPAYEIPAVQPSPLEKPKKEEFRKLATKQYCIVGQLFETYWIVEYEDRMYIIDQHAAHEKVLYERLMSQIQNESVESQMITPPIVLSLSMQEENLLKQYWTQFETAGFSLESFGGHEYTVRAVPANLPSINKKELLMEMLDQLSADCNNIKSNLILEKIASMSCKAAVKGNMRLQKEEADSLIGELLTLKNPYNCPHGRPVMITMTRYELEKKFKRVVE